MIAKDSAWTGKLGVDPLWNPVGYRKFYNAGAIWGAIGPSRFFLSHESHYHSLLWGFLIGFGLPFLPYLAYKIRPHKMWKWINLPVLLYFGSTGSPQNEIIVQLAINLFFQLYLFRYRNEWFNKYTYVLAAAATAGVAICVLCINFLDLIKGSSGKSVTKQPVWVLNPNTTPDFYCFDANVGFKAA